MSPLILGALIGAAGGTVLYLGVIDSLLTNLAVKLIAAVSLVAVCSVMGALVPRFRCLVLLMVPGLLGSSGRSWLFVFTLSQLFKGPASNIHHNVETAALSLSCSLELQLNNSKLLWRDAVKPFVLITKELVDSKAEFESDVLNISRSFQSVVLQYGNRNSVLGNSTQQRFTAKTMMQCNGVVEEGVQRCADWFRRRWEECMEAVPVPVVSHVVCVSMKFDFLCDILRVMTPWCTQQIPVERNFGKLLDQLNSSMDQLSREFSAELVLQEQHQQSVLGGGRMEQNFTYTLTESFRNLKVLIKQLLNTSQMLLSWTFNTLTVIQAMTYLRCYQRDIQFDNFYITAHFRQMDADRRTAGKRFLLPLTKTLVDPFSLRMRPEELQLLVSSGWGALYLATFCVVLLLLDFSVFHVLQIVSRHSSTQFNLSSGHQVDVRVDGTSLMARLLRRTVSAFNSSSNLNIHSDNQACVPSPSSLPAGVYVSCVCCVLLVALWTWLQVYSHRLYHSIAASFHPQREEKRILFLYNLQLQVFCGDHKTLRSRGLRVGAVSGCEAPVPASVRHQRPPSLQVFPCLRRFGCFSGSRETRESLDEPSPILL